MRTPLGTIMTSAGELEICLTDQDDAELVRSLLIEAANWMVSVGIRQWNPEQFTEQEIATYFAKREIYLVVGPDGPVGMFTLQQSDPDYWGSLNEEGYSYLHRLTVTPSYRGHALGRDFIYWAARRSRELGRKGLRFDCWSENRKLNPYYSKLGMETRGKGALNGREYILYEMNSELYRKL
ncbi:GNAT family N-acetyltransferase [Paenibacillus vini]|uniref:GNAT family N-acetyltransferase n=1 Tax=Paenibacillus vini TaxID=1476024 RepID=UPI001BCA76B8|nr:GNAT family N-acetyltransferase [Paenibacillus vini]